MDRGDIGSQSLTKKTKTEAILIEEVFANVGLVESATAHTAVCIDNCNAACYIPGAPDGAQVTSFHKKHTPS